MYIWILLAAIMTALAFYNVSPRADKDHALNEIRAASVSNRFRIEHEAVLKTMECELLYHRNAGCWDSAESSGGCSEETSRQSAIGPVDVSCFNPLAYNGSDCSGVVGDKLKTIGDESNQIRMRTFPKVEEDNPDAYNYFTKQIPLGYDTGKQVFTQGGIHHFIYCLNEVAEKATEDSFVDCKTMKHETDEEPTDPENSGLEPTEPEEETTTESTTKKKEKSQHTRYLVTFAPVPDKWLSRRSDKDETHNTEAKYPLPVLIDTLSKASSSSTVYGWTSCTTPVGGQTTCMFSGANTRSANIRNKKNSRRNKDDEGNSDQKGISINLRSYDDTTTVNEETGETEKSLKATTHSVLEFDVLKTDALFWKNETFRAVCGNYPCLFAYQRIATTDTAYHCYNMLHPGNPKSNKWKKKHGIEESESGSEPTSDPEPEPIN